MGERYVTDIKGRRLTALKRLRATAKRWGMTPEQIWDENASFWSGEFVKGISVRVLIDEFEQVPERLLDVAREVDRYEAELRRLSRLLAIKVTNANLKRKRK